MSPLNPRKHWVVSGVFDFCPCCGVTIPDKAESDDDVFDYIEDRVSRYENEQLASPLKRNYLLVRSFWIAGAILNFVGVSLMIFSSLITLNKNFNVELNLVRVDGGQVTESFDVRRKVMIRNTLEQVKLKNEIKAREAGK